MLQEEKNSKNMYCWSNWIAAGSLNIAETGQRIWRKSAGEEEKRSEEMIAFY